MKQKALITGASRGIGLAIVQLFEKNAIEVIIPSRQEMDLSDITSIKNYTCTLPDDITILINNAGVNFIENIDKISEKNFLSSIAINLMAPIFLTETLAPKMAKNGYGKIINISSVWSLISKPGRGVYSAAKAGINSFTRTAAIEFAANNVLINSIAPGFVDTDLTRQNNTQAQIEAIKSQIPLGRLASTNEIAELVYFLASQKNTYITGQTISADGGLTCI